MFFSDTRGDCLHKDMYHSGLAFVVCPPVRHHFLSIKAEFPGSLWLWMSSNLEYEAVHGKVLPRFISRQDAL